MYNIVHTLFQCLFVCVFFPQCCANVVRCAYMAWCMFEIATLLPAAPTGSSRGTWKIEVNGIFERKMYECALFSVYRITYTVQSI